MNRKKTRPKRRQSAVYASNCKDYRLRGTAHQIVDKYEALAKEAGTDGDEILEQLFLNHAEHYRKEINNVLQT